MENAFGLLVVVFGLILGSFFNVLILRLPQNKFLSSTRSQCPICGHTIRFYDNIPILSFLLLRARCRDCGAPISWQYPAVEAATALLALFLFRVMDWPVELSARNAWQAGAVLLLLFLVPVCVIDLRHRIIPDSITLGGLILGLLLSLLPQGMVVSDALLGALTGGGALWAIGFAGERIYKKEAMGGGDIKLMAMGGALLGFKLTLLALFLSTLLGSVIGLLHKLRYKESYFPFGPSLAAGILIAWTSGERLLQWYLAFFRL